MSFGPVQAARGLRWGAVLAAAISLALLSMLTTNEASQAADASIAGVVWEDLNLDGRKQPDEPGMPRIGLQLFGPIPSTISSSGTGNTNLALTDEAGSYSFKGLVPGSYRVQVGVGGQTFASTHPARILPGVNGPIDAIVSLADQPYDSLDFGLVRLPNLSPVTGIAWVDGARAERPEVRAFINGFECGAIRAQSAGPDPTAPSAVQGPGSFQVFVAPDRVRSDCGRAGDVVSFTINGRPANETATFPPPINLTLTSEPPFAVYTGELQVTGPVAASRGIVAQVDGRQCGAGIALPRRTTRDVSQYEVSVLPDSVRPGCGVNGSLIEFYVDGVALGTARWRPGFHAFDFVGERPVDSLVQPPTSGDAGLQAP